MPTFTVTNTNDAGAGSLRQAILDANNSPGADEVVFSGLFSSAQTIQLTSGKIVIDDALSVVGPGSNRLTLDATGNSRHFDVHDTYSSEVRISGLRFINGHASGGDQGDYGGAVFAYNTYLTISECVFSGNESDNDGGAIYLQGGYYSRLRVSKSQFTDNFAADDGGAITTYSSAELREITVSNNHTENGNGGGIDVNLSGGKRFILVDSVVTGNEAGTISGTANGGGIALYSSYGDEITLLRATVSDNEAASSGGGATLRGGHYYWPQEVLDSTFSNNSAESGGGIWARSGWKTFRNLNLTSNHATNGSGGGLYLSYAQGELLGCTVSGNTASQRGGGIRAFYGYADLTNTIVNSNSATAEGGGIAWERGNSRWERLELQGNTSGSRGGGFWSSNANLSVEEAFVSGNTAASHGGGAYLLNAYATMTEPQFRQNTSTAGEGGGLRLQNTFLIVDTGTIANNTANQQGGGVAASGTFLWLQGSTVSGNTAGTLGGGLRNNASYVRLDQSTVSGNTATSDGGGLASVAGGFSLLNNSTIAANTAVRGGGLWLDVAGTAVQSNSSIIGDNTATGGSADIQRNAGTLSADHSLFETVSGGAVNGANTDNIIADPKLGALAENGGPTRTHKLLNGSPAIEAGANGNGFSTDQRGEGYQRVAGFQPDIGALEAQLTFTLVPNPVPEGATAVLTATFEAAPPNAMTVGFENLSGAATLGEDFTLSADSFVIQANQTSASVMLNAIDDGIEEREENIQVRGFGGRGEFSIRDNTMPVAAFTTDTQTGREGQSGGVLATVHLSQAAAADIVIPVTLGGTATPQDYSVPASEIRVPAGSSEGSLVVNLLADNDTEAEETIEITLVPSGIALGAPATQTITIARQTAGCSVVGSDGGWVAGGGMSWPLLLAVGTAWLRKRRQRRR